MVLLSVPTAPTSAALLMEDHHARDLSVLMCFAHNMCKLFF